ncbi:MAG: GNAT family N-acetyltransferase [Bdellovibrionales bacterium]|nr:GNAT family N-acetyltransferase [Bdellovibrionales bacterium]
MLDITYYFGAEILPQIETVSQLRIQEFKNYPYLYVGTKEYEENYLRGFATDPKSCLAIARMDGEVAGIATAMPLKSDADILKDVEKVFAEAGEQIELYYYFGEFIVLSKYRRLGISMRIEKDLEAIARSQKFSKLCLSTVVREQNDSRRPPDYKATDSVWSKMGFFVTRLKIEYHWPTIQEDGRVVDTINSMRFWEKVL